MTLIRQHCYKVTLTHKWNKRKKTRVTYYYTCIFNSIHTQSHNQDDVSCEVLEAEGGKRCLWYVLLNTIIYVKPNNVLCLCALFRHEYIYIDWRCALRHRYLIDRSALVLSQIDTTTAVTTVLCFFSEPNVTCACVIHAIFIAGVFNFLFCHLPFFPSKLPSSHPLILSHHVECRI